MHSRDELWSRLTEETFDLLIIGGGITGAGAFRDAAHRGLKVALVEMVDFASGTSSRSSKLVHGGLRYLEHYEFSLVFEAVSERRVLQNIAPHIVNPLAFLFPVYDTSRVSMNTLRAGMWVYDALALFRAPKTHTTLSKRSLRKKEPALGQDGLKGAPLYYDCATDDTRLTMETLLDGLQRGGVAANYTRVDGLVKNDDGRIIGASICDEIDGRRSEVRAKAVVNATGPWTDRTRAYATGAAPLLRPTKGVHVVVQSSRLPVSHAVVCTHPEDKRVLFAIPWGEQTYIGTTDTDHEGDPAAIRATGEDVDYLLGCANHYFPEVDLTRDDVIATWAGLRPLISQEGSTASVSREHEIVVDPAGLITIAGGKLTTYRKMGAEVVQSALNLMALFGQVPDGVGDAQTGREPLPGAVGWPENDDASTVAAEVVEAGLGKVSDASARYLTNRYGTRGLDIARLAASNQGLAQVLIDERPELMAEVDWAVGQELCLRLNDFMCRRTQLYFRDNDQGLGAAEAVAERMGELLGWDEQRTTEEVLAYQAEVARSRAWRSD